MGMTAIDAATQAKRLGAKEVTMVYRRTEEEKNCTQVELDIALLDGCKIMAGFPKRDHRRQWQSKIILFVM